MMQVLLDTHALLWWLTDSPRMKATWRRTLGDSQTRVVVSAASIWEIAIKTAMGRLELELPKDVVLSNLAAVCGFEDMPVSARHAAAVMELPPHHADPFDRILVAQAKLERLTLVSADKAVRAYDVELLR
jgi:PIN domain nuclease of toxin-antitoxin system